MTEPATPTSPPAPRWRPLNSIDRRVLGVLGEKAKTTPDAYPMSLNGVVSGCNQKSNRAPVLQLEPDQVEDSLDRLREYGAVALVEGSGRVQRYRHYLYEWLGVSKVELSVMIELLLRGPQTVGELRGRVSRMDPIEDLDALRELLGSLKSKGLVIPLTPEGRGQVFTHALFPLRDLEQQKLQHSQPAAWHASAEGEAHQEAPAAAPSQPASSPAIPRPAPPANHHGQPQPSHQDIEQLRSQFKQQQAEIEEIKAALRHVEDELQDLRRALGG